MRSIFALRYPADSRDSPSTCSGKFAISYNSINFLELNSQEVKEDYQVQHDLLLQKFSSELPVLKPPFPKSNH
jgi:hypothetical protein